MGDGLSPFAVLPPHPPSSSNKTNNMPMLYGGLVVVGTAAIVLAIYNVIIIKRFGRRHTHMQPEAVGPNRLVEVVTASWSFENSQKNLLSSSKYKTEARGRGEEQEEQQGGDDNECPVCLSVYEEGEEVRKLPRCKHCFHALCIDRWLYSHFDCPICRTPVGPFCHRFPVAENSRGRGVLLESGGASI